MEKITLNKFVADWTNKVCDWDGRYGVQCMDVMAYYLEQVAGISRADIWQHFAESSALALYLSSKTCNFYQKINRDGANVPQRGDILFFGRKSGQWGHVCIVISADKKGFKSFDANWPVGSLPHIQEHTYTGVLGWLRMKIHHASEAIIINPNGELNIKDYVLTVNYDEGRCGNEVEGVIMHPCFGTFTQSLEWMNNLKAFTSTHFIVKKDGEIAKCVETKNTAWHTNMTEEDRKYLQNTGTIPALVKKHWENYTPINYYTVGIFMEDEKNPKWAYPTFQYTALVYLVADIFHRYKLKPSRESILTHIEVNPLHGKSPLGKWNHDKFVQDVAKVIAYEYTPLEEHFYEKPVDRRIRSDVDAANKRFSPFIADYNVESFYLKKEAFKAVSYVVGENVSLIINGEKLESNIWYKTAENLYIWSELIVELPGGENLSGKAGEYKMTQNEKEKLIAELVEQRKTIEARIDEVKEVEVESQGAEDAQPEVETPAEPVVEEPKVEEPKAEEVPAEPVVEVPTPEPEAPIAEEATPEPEVVEEKKEEVETPVEKVEEAPKALSFDELMVAVKATVESFLASKGMAL